MPIKARQECPNRRGILYEQCTASVTAPDNINLFPLELVLFDAPCHLQHLLLLPLVHILQPGRNAGAGISACVHDVSPVMVLRLVQQGLNARLHGTPSTSIKRLFLRPDNSLRIWIRVQVLLELSPWEGVELFETGDGRGGVTKILAMLEESGEDLACAEDDTLNLVVRLDFVGCVSLVGNDPLEMRFASEILNG